MPVRVGIAAAVLALAGCGGSERSDPPHPAGEREAVRTLESESVGDRAPVGRAPTVPLAPLEPAATPLFRLAPIARGLREPVYMTAPESEPDLLYIVERAGRVLVLDDGELRSDPFLDIRDQVRTEIEEGLHSLAFHPDFGSNGRFFVAFNDRSGDIRVVERHAKDDQADPDYARELLVVDKPEGVKWHNGGQLQFGPDGGLYVTFGDAARNPFDEMEDPPDTADPDNNAQNLELLFGKLLRLDVDAPEPEPELVAYGLRNVWRFSFDRETDDLYLADVGQFGWEELDYLPAGSAGVTNFGWSRFEANAPYNAEHELNALGRLVWPVLRYQHGPSLYCSIRGSIVGGYVYRGDEIPELVGRYVFGDYCSGEVWTTRIDGGSVADTRLEPVTVANLSSFGEDARGELYAAALETGVVYRLERAR